MNAHLKATLPKDAALGQKTGYPKVYDPGLLQPISRQNQRRAMGLDPKVAFVGVDMWNAYELSWVDALGKPVRAMATFHIPALSPFLPESKSVKLYLNSLNHKCFSGPSEVSDLIARDLSEVAGALVTVELNPRVLSSITNLSEYYCVDELPVKISTYQYSPELLMQQEGCTVEQKLCSHLFKAHCLCTGQPDWGSVFIDYAGPRIDESSLLRYLISFNEHDGFSENCIEQIYVDLMLKFKPKKLLVFGKFSRRGGIDITPYRALEKMNWPHGRLSFQ
jgi:7-cyano-7-deazaguanine reductase